MVHDVRLWRTQTTACGVILFAAPSGHDGLSVDLSALGFRVVRPGPVTTGPVDCMSCLVARRTPYAVLCDDHGQQFLTAEEYDYQMSRPDSLWRCPRCGESAHWDDDEYEASLEEEGSDDNEANEADSRTDQGR